MAAVLPPMSVVVRRDTQAMPVRFLLACSPVNMVNASQMDPVSVAVASPEMIAAFPAIPVKRLPTVLVPMPIVE